MFVKDFIRFEVGIRSMSFCIDMLMWLCIGVGDCVFC